MQCSVLLMPAPTSFSLRAASFSSLAFSLSASFSALRHKKREISSWDSQDKLYVAVPQQLCLSLFVCVTLSVSDDQAGINCLHQKLRHRREPLQQSA